MTELIIANTENKNNEGFNMTNLVEMNNGQLVTTSLQVAETFGKQHKHVLESIEKSIAENSALVQMYYLDCYLVNNRKQKMYYMNRDGFFFLAMGFTGKKATEFKLTYINAFNDMEKTLKTNSQLAISDLQESHIELMESVDKLKDFVTNQIPLSSAEKVHLRKIVARVVTHNLKTKNSSRAKEFARVWGKSNVKFGYSNIHEIPKIRFNDVYQDFLNQIVGDKDQLKLDI